jgi:hypothetical protein
MRMHETGIDSVLRILSRLRTMLLEPSRKMVSILYVNFVFPLHLGLPFPSRRSAANLCVPPE